MAATIFIEQDRGTFIRAPHRYNGYNSGYNTSRSETPQVDPPPDPAVRRRDVEHPRAGW